VNRSGVRWSVNRAGALAVVALALLACTPANRAAPTGSAASPAPANVTPNPTAAAAFYQGKTVHLIVGFTAGGGFDTLGRLVARHLGSHIPGNPTIVVDNMPGASGLVAANYVYSAAPKDGTVIAVFSEPGLQGQLLKADGVQFDARNFNWLGSTQVQTNLCIARTDSGITNFQQLLQPGGSQLIVGTTGPGSNIHDFPAALRGALNANFKLVSGYPGTADISLAVESGEVQGICTPWESVKVSRPHWFEGSPPFATILVQQGTERHPDLPNVPLAEEFAQNDEQRQVIRAATSTLAMSKPLVAPPGVPPERVAALRQAFVETMKDPELIADAEQSNIDLSVKSPEQVEKIVAQVLDSPPNVAQRLKEYLEATQ